jgi:AraC-like DNA-binding protein
MLQPLDINHSAFTYYPRLEKVERYVDENISQPIPVGVAARVAGLRPTYFSTYFRTKTGVRFTDWITHRRISVAVDLIESRDISLTRVGVSVGFQNVSTFERAFKKWCGMTPSEFRKQARPD